MNGMIENFRGGAKIFVNKQKEIIELFMLAYI